MSLDLNAGTGGDASADVPTASSEVESVGQDTPAEPSPIDSSGVDDIAADPTQLSQSDEAAEKAVESPEDEEAALLAAANDPTTPQWAREKIKEAMGYAGKLKAQISEFQTEATNLRTQYEGKEVLPPEEITRLKAAEDRVFALSSITATPEDLDKHLREMNPRVYDDYRSHLVWNAVANPDGTPDLENLQFIVDRFAGEPGKVSAKDVLAAVDALKNDRLSPLELHQFETQEQFEAFQRQTEAEKRIAEREALTEQNAKYQEAQIRTSELSQAASQLQSQVATAKNSLFEKFKLAPVENEPKTASDYKARVNARVEQAINSAPSEIRELGELVKFFELLGQPGQKPLSGPEAAAEVKRVIQSAQYQQLAAKGLSALTSKIEEIVSQEALFYKYMMKGYELEASKPKTARPVLGAPNQSDAMVPLTEADLAKMSTEQRADYAAQQLTNELRGMRYGQTPRIG